MEHDHHGRRKDETLALLREGYDFIRRRGLWRGRPWFETRLMLRSATCLSGGDAPEVLYEPGRFTRVGALPPTTLRLLQDVGSVNQLDGASHMKRKAGFMALLTPDANEALAAVFERRLAARLEASGRLQLLAESERLLCGSALEWIGAPVISRRQLSLRTREFAAMVGRAGAADISVAGALALRRRSELWAKGLISDVRKGRTVPNAASPLAEVARWADDEGRPLPLETAAVELINFIRPTVAVARYVVFAADALRRHPEWRLRLMAEPHLARSFALEVRRFYPFFPAVGGRVLEPFDWEGRRFAKGEWVLADLHGANHDPGRWRQPEVFDPERFEARPELSARITAQGAGDPRLGHRCPGEGATIEIVARAALQLASVEARLPEQDFAIPMDRLPTAPKDRFVMDIGQGSGTDTASGKTLRCAVLGMAAALGALGLGFATAPKASARLFGIPARADALPYVRALGFRDLGLAVALVLAATSPRAVRAVAGGGAIIPLLDVILVARAHGRRGIGAIALHAVSAGALLTLASVAGRLTRRIGARRR